MCGGPSQLYGDTRVNSVKDPKEKFPLISLDRFLSSVKMANREQKNIVHDEENPVNWGKEEVDSWLQLQWPQLGKGSHPKPIVQFFLTLFKQPLTPPRFEHVCCKFFWTTFKKVRQRLSRQNLKKIMRKCVGKYQTYPKI